MTRNDSCKWNVLAPSNVNSDAVSAVSYRHGRCVADEERWIRVDQLCRAFQNNNSTKDVLVFPFSKAVQMAFCLAAGCALFLTLLRVTLNSFIYLND